MSSLYFFYNYEEMPKRTPRPRQLGELERAVMLAILALQPEAYGVAIQRTLSSRLDREISFGAVYTTLDRLERKGLVSSHHGEPTPNRGGRAKKLFSVQEVGIDALNADRRTTEALWAMKPLRGNR